MGEKEKQGGKARTYQKKNWKRYFDWENPNSRTYKIIEVYEQCKPKTENRGGKRKNAGPKLVLEDEINCLIDYFIWKHYSDNSNEVHFIYQDWLTFLECSFPYDIETNDEKVNKHCLYEIQNKIYEKIQSLIYDRIEKHKKNLLLSDGIVAFRKLENNRNYDSKYKDCLDYLLNPWLNYREAYLEENNLKIHQILSRDEHIKMIKYITDKINTDNNFDYYSIMKCKKVVIVSMDFSECSKQKYMENKRIFKKKLCEDLYKYFYSRCEDVAFCCVANNIDYESYLSKILEPYNYIIDSYLNR